MFKFNRTFKLTVQDTEGELITLEQPLTLDFTVRRGLQTSVNEGNFKLYNLDATTRNVLFKDSYNISEYRKIILKAGYGENDPIIFQGNLVSAKSYRQGGSTNFITELSAFDGGWDFANGIVQQTYAVNTTFQQVINDLVSSFSYIKVGAVSSFPGVYPKPYAVSGKKVYVLQTVSGNRFFVDLELAYVLKDGDAIEGDVLLISSESGLLGTPKRQDTSVVVDVLFEPRIKVGQLVEVRSPSVSIYDGIYQVQGFEHFGTISGAVGGVCKTTMYLYVGSQVFQTLLGKGAFNA